MYRNLFTMSYSYGEDGSEASGLQGNTTSPLCDDSLYEECRALKNHFPAEFTGLCVCQYCPVLCSSINLLDRLRCENFTQQGFCDPVITAILSSVAPIASESNLVIVLVLVGCVLAFCAALLAYIKRKKLKSWWRTRFPEAVATLRTAEASLNTSVGSSAFSDLDALADRPSEPQIGNRDSLISHRFWELNQKTGKTGKEHRILIDPREHHAVNVQSASVANAMS